MSAPQRTQYGKGKPAPKTAAGKPAANAKGQPPVMKIRVGLVFASIWANTTEKGTFYNVTFETRYKDGDGNWQSGKSYSDRDLLALVKAADLASTWILQHAQGLANNSGEVASDNDEIPY